MGELSLMFMSPWMAWAGLALAAVPIIIHLLNRRRFQVVPWAAMEFLLAAMKRNRRRLKFEQWLLLAARCAVLILLGVALTRPVGCDRTSWASWAGGARGLSVIILDNSYSMAYQADRPGAATHLDQARRLAGQLIERLGAGGQSVALITAARPAAAVLATPTFDLERVRSSIDRVAQSASDTDMPGALHEAIRIASESKESDKNLYIFTDATRGAWEGDRAAALGELGPRLARLYRVHLFNLGLSEQSNRAIVSLALESRQATTHDDVAARASAAIFGNLPEAAVRWTLDGRPVAEDQPLGGAGVKELTTSPIRMAEAGPHILSAAISQADRLPMDDRRWRVVDVASKVKVLLVEGSAGLTPMSGSADFLKLALAPPVDPGSPATAGDIEPTVINDLELPNQIFTEDRAIAFTDVPRVSEDQARRLRDFVQRGGAILWFMGPHVDAAEYNRVLLPLGLLPGALVQRVSSAADGEGFGFDFNPNGLVHPYLDAFRNQEKSGLSSARIFTYWRIEPLANLHAQRVLNYRAANGQPADPAITVQSLGMGNIVFFTTTANADWTSLPAKPAYVALMNELLGHAITSPDGWMNLSVGESLAIPPAIKLTANPTLSDPRNVPVPLIQETTADGTQYHSPSLEQPGIYTLLTGSGRYPIAVNVPTDEADVRTLNDAALRKILGGIDITFASDSLPPMAGAADTADWSRLLLLALLALAALECYGAMRQGHYRDTRRRAVN